MIILCYTFIFIILPPLVSSLIFNNQLKTLININNNTNDTRATQIDRMSTRMNLILETFPNMNNNNNSEDDVVDELDDVIDAHKHVN
jgi:predicted PurR-regulated permease PerM